jgi:hypothetical protein
MYTHISKCENSEMIPLETVPGIRGRGNERGNEFKYDILIPCKNFCKYSNVPPPSTAIIKK